MTELYDIIIIGGGPGGLAAGIYGGRSRLKTLILQKGKPGGQAATTQLVENYPGFPKGTTGPALIQAMVEQAVGFGTEIIQEEVVDLKLDGEIKEIKTKKNRELFSKTVILAPGAEPRSLNIKGERRLCGRGVSYCATCDADFFEGLDVVVVGNGDAAIEEAMYLTKFAETVTIIVINEEGVLDCNKASSEKAFLNKKIKWVWNSVLEEIIGDELVEKVVIKNLKTGQLTEMKTNGVFIFIGSVPKTGFLKGKVQLNEQGYIVTNDKMETSVPGVFAVGDARMKYLRQIVTAVNDGAIAAVAAERYIAEKEDFEDRVLKSKEPVLAIFWDPLNKNSIRAVSLLESFFEDNKTSIKLEKINTYRNKKYAQYYGIDELPTMLLFNKGEMVLKLTGCYGDKKEIK